jgi:SAM-dependent methyltransferase
MAETSKAHDRRVREGFFENYCGGNGIDIGFGGDILCPNCVGWDRVDGDATYLEGVSDNSFDFVYSSHCLEHIPDMETALKNWWRILKRGGYLILFLPHRDLYEKKKDLPSRWSGEHLCYFLPSREEPPCTVGVLQLLHRALGVFGIMQLSVCSAGNVIVEPTVHSNGEYSIEAIIQKI